MAQFAYYGNQCNTIGGFPCADCPPKTLGRIRSVAFVPTTYTFANISNTNEWFANIINPALGFIIPYTNGSLSMTPKEDNSFGNYNKEVSSYEIVIEGMEPNPTQTATWWNTLSLNKGYQVVARIDNQVISSTGIGIQAIPHFKVDDDIQSRVFMGFTIKWVQGLMPTFFSAPIGIFDNCAESNDN